MAGKCSQPNCYPHETGCDERGGLLEKCKYYNSKAQE